MKKVFIILICCLMLSLLPGCGGGQDEALIKVELHEVTRSVFYAPQYVASTLGFFEDEGLDLNIVTSGDSNKAMTALLAGQADICLAGPETGVFVYNEGREDAPVCIGQLTKRDGSFLIAREPADNFSWSELENKTIIGGRRGGMPLMTLLYVLNQHGLVPGENITVIDSIQFPLMAGAFEGGEGDYVTLFEPTATEFQNAGKGYIVANIGLESGEVPYTCFFASPDSIENEPELIEAFLRAVYRAQQWIQTATDEEIAEAMQPHFPDTSIESLMIVARSYRETDSWKTELEMFESDYNRLLDIIDFAGELSARPPFEALIDNSFAQKIQAE
ncbi:MAG: ABC transporter substrate-binding protein [Clostridia bacterium]|nr:ABC transporter substrate-binding protein [Clostridia bacterium]